MDIRRAQLATCCDLKGTIVVIDVLRSFSTAAYVFAAGASAIFPVATVEAARKLRAGRAAALTIGAVGGGAPIEGFDLSNSPAALCARAPDLSGRELIHCTAGGVRGLLACAQADAVFAASLVCAGATARRLRRLDPGSVTLVVTGDWIDRDGDEDRACADYLEALLRGEEPDPAPFVLRVRNSDFGRRFGSPAYPALPAADLDCCAIADRFDFAMQVERRGECTVMTAVA